ncbi:MAG: thiamine pyrophosphate-dependent dehydrogenase E1 component subunit alpha [Actinobacteria bacterium]|nr:thiamine pyrophosphate-dependent dehydrogenase E1 component subunit alpha [Actinomycetota bacterium]
MEEKIIKKFKLLRMYRQMYRIRKFEEKIYLLFATGSMPGTMHQYSGQEAIAVGTCENLSKEDYITTTHRSHGHYIAKGAPIHELMAELFAKKTGCCKGMGGSLHIGKLEAGVIGVGGIVGAGITIAAGLGLSVKLRETSQVVVCFFGDGAVNTGAFHEGVNLAAIWRLPVVFVCENNLYGFSTPVSKVTLLKDLAEKARGYGIPGVMVNGNDVLEVYKTVGEAVQRAREDKGPMLVECKTYRYKGHARFEPGNYRPKKEVEDWLRRDPICQLESKLIDMRILSPQEVQSLQEKVKEEIENALTFAQNSPDSDDPLKYLYT